MQVLSRGTREQLFVSLRLALVAAYARRGIHLPMILDDVFVNYDAGRTRTACAVLREFAKQGHQLLVFTCHEHVWRMFQDIKVDTRRIPNRHGEIEEEAPDSRSPSQFPSRRSSPLSSRNQSRLHRSQFRFPEPIKVKSQPKPPVVEEPELIIEEPEEAIDEEPIAEPEPAPAISEIEYWWDSASPNGTRHYEEDATTDWLPEPEIRQRGRLSLLPPVQKEN